MRTVRNIFSSVLLIVALFTSAQVQAGDKAFTVIAGYTGGPSTDGSYNGFEAGASYELPVFRKLSFEPTAMFSCMNNESRDAWLIGLSLRPVLNVRLPMALPLSVFTGPRADFSVLNSGDFVCVPYPGYVCPSRRDNTFEFNTYWMFGLKVHIGKRITLRGSYSLPMSGNNNFDIHAHLFEGAVGFTF